MHQDVSTLLRHAARPNSLRMPVLPDDAAPEIYRPQIVSRCVYVIDPHRAAHKALVSLLRTVRFDVESFTSPLAFLDRFQSAAADQRCCVISEIRMPGMSGLELQAELRRRNSNAGLVLVSKHADVPTTVRAMRAGALSVMKKPVREQELIDVLNSHFNASAADRNGNVSEVFAAHRARLTARQRDVFDHLILGLQTKEVAALLDLSPRTVEVHRAQILKRLEAGSVSQLIRETLGRLVAHV